MVLRGERPSRLCCKSSLERKPRFARGAPRLAVFETWNAGSTPSRYAIRNTLPTRSHPRIPQSITNFRQADSIIHPISIAHPIRCWQIPDMITPQPSRFASQCRIRIFLFPVIALCVLRSEGYAARSTHPLLTTEPADQQFFCSAGYDPAACQQHALRLKSVLLRYPSRQLGPWSWIIVRSEDWQPLLTKLRLNLRSPAFTTLEQHATFLEEALFQRDPERSQQLEREFYTPFDQLLSLAVTHELAHAICRVVDETTANLLAEQLRDGRPIECSQTRGLTPIQELNLHRQSPRLR